jgi:alpha-tubulin suppressor-like RCC1 family protein
MVTSLKNLKNEVDSRLAGGGLYALACCQLQNAETILDNNIVYSVANIASLPDAELNEGRFVYVEDINEYRFSNQTWSDDPSSTVCVYQNQLWTWGGGYSTGFLGDGTTINKCSPIREFCSAIDWSQVSVNQTTNARAAAIKSSGELWGWGCNACFAIGDGTLTNKCSPVREICSATDWCQVSAGGTFTTAIKTTGQIWAWGSGVCGRLGDGTITQRCSPVREFCSATDWCQLSSRNAIAAVKTSGELWIWGLNACGNFGDGTTISKCSPIREICSATDWCQASVGYNTTASVKTTGELWTWGRNLCGELGNGRVISVCSPVREFCSGTNWCQVSAGHRVMMAIKTSGELWGWGAGFCGNFGDGTTVGKCSPVREFCSGTNWCQVSSGCLHTMAVKTNGEIWAWGNGTYGRLGDGTTTSRCSPVREFCSATNWCQVSAGGVFSAAIKSYTKGFLE